MENQKIVESQKEVEKKSIFWELPYWEFLEVRNCLDVMHIVKNICDSLIGLLLNILGKTKYGVNARKDMVERGSRLQLAPEEGKRGAYLPPTCCTMSKADKCNFVNGYMVLRFRQAILQTLRSWCQLKTVNWLV